MEPALRQRLIAINRRFYLEAADRFIDRRRRPWIGWQRTLDVVEAAGLPDRPRVLDVGCGNGRFAAFLAERGHAIDYLGLDASPVLLARARMRSLAGTLFVSSDLTAALANSAQFDLVAAFGLLHHVPGREYRRRLIDTFSDRVASGGHLVVTLWSPEAKRRRRATPVDGGESGDVLLPWGDELGLQRYCHFFEDAEVEEFAALVGPNAIHFRADGRDGENHYLVARSPRGEGGTVE